MAALQGFHWKAMAAVAVVGFAMVGGDVAEAQRATETEGSCRRIPAQYGKANVWYGKLIAFDDTSRSGGGGGSSVQVNHRVRCFTTEAACRQWLRVRTQRARQIDFIACNKGGHARRTEFQDQRAFF